MYLSCNIIRNINIFVFNHCFKIDLAKLLDHLCESNLRIHP